MDSELEKMLEGVSVPIESSWSDSLRFQKFKKLNIFNGLILFKNKKFRLKLVKTSCLLIVVIVVLMLFAGGKSGPVEIKKASAVKPNDKLIENIAKLIVLPDERPIIATIVDIKTLIDNPFFKGAKKGDKLLIFENSARAVLYNIEMNRLVNVGTPQQTGITYK